MSWKTLARVNGYTLEKNTVRKDFDEYYVTSPEPNKKPMFISNDPREARAAWKAISTFITYISEDEIASEISDIRKRSGLS